LDLLVLVGRAALSERGLQLFAMSRNLIFTDRDFFLFLREFEDLIPDCFILAVFGQLLCEFLGFEHPLHLTQSPNSPLIFLFLS